MRKTFAIAAFVLTLAVLPAGCPNDPPPAPRDDHTDPQLLLLYAGMDSDHDGLTNAEETARGLNPNDPNDGPDRDGDGIPNEADTDVDGDGIPNEFDADVDGDGVTNEFDPDIDGDHIENAIDLDMDGDGIPNRWDIDIDGDFKFNDQETSKDPNETDKNPIKDLSETGEEALKQALGDDDCGPLVDDCAGLVRKIVGQFNDRVVQSDSIFAPDGVRDQVNSAMDRIIAEARDRGEVRNDGNQGFDALLSPNQPMFGGLDAVASNLFHAFKEGADDPESAVKDFAARTEAIADLSETRDDTDMGVVGEQILKLRGGSKDEKKTWDGFDAKDLKTLTGFVGQNARDRGLELAGAVDATITVKQTFKKEKAADIAAGMNTAMDNHFGSLSDEQKNKALKDTAKGAAELRKRNPQISLADALNQAAEVAAADAAGNGEGGGDGGGDGGEESP